DRKDRLRVGVAGLLGGAGRRVPLHDEQLRLTRVPGRAVGQLVGEAARLEARFAPRQLPGLASRLTGLGGVDGLLDDAPRLRAVPLQPLRQAPVEDLLDVGPDLGVAELGLDRKSTRLNSSHVKISYAVFCLKKKNK